MAAKRTVTLHYSLASVKIVGPECLPFVAELEASIPYMSRTYNALGDYWIVYAPHIGYAAELAKKHYDRVIDSRVEGSFGKVPKPPPSNARKGFAGNETHSSGYDPFRVEHPNVKFNYEDLIQRATDFRANAEHEPERLEDFVALYGHELGHIKYREREERLLREQVKRDQAAQAGRVRAEREANTRTYAEATERERRKHGPGAEQTYRFFSGANFWAEFEQRQRATGYPFVQVTQEDSYIVLGCSRTDSKETVRAAYRKLALELHPDRNGSPEALLRMQKVNAAWTEIKKSRDW